jgi:hypothetical protein
MEDRIKEGPQIGEKWTIDGFTGLIFLGRGEDYAQEKFLIFSDPEHNYSTQNNMFIITKDRFWAADTFKEKENE